MILENVPSEFLQSEEPVWVFSDDLRFIYELTRFEDPAIITVFDSIYNECVKLLPDQSVIDLCNHLDRFSVDDGEPKFCIIDNRTLLIFFDDDHFKVKGSGLIVVVQLNFSNNSYSLLDSKLIQGCSGLSGTLGLVKKDDQFLIAHTFSIGNQIDYGLGYFSFSLNDDNTISQPQKNRVVFDFILESSE